MTNYLAPDRPTLDFGAPDWVHRDQVACDPHTADDWYGGPDSDQIGKPRTRPATDRAKEACANCDVREKCLTTALENGERWGIWGGVDFERDGAELRRRIA